MNVRSEQVNNETGEGKLKQSLYELSRAYS